MVGVGVGPSLAVVVQEPVHQLPALLRGRLVPGKQVLLVAGVLPPIVQLFVALAAMNDVLPPVGVHEAVAVGEGAQAEQDIEPPVSVGSAVKFSRWEDSTTQVAGRSSLR